MAKAKALLQEAGQTAITLEFLVPTGQAPGGVAWSDLAAKLSLDANSRAGEASRLLGEVLSALPR